MKKYNILYKDILIGILEINEQEQHRYTPDAENVEKVKKMVPLIHEMTEKTDWRDPIPFFKNRIDNSKRFSQEDDIRSHTDFFRMIKQQ